MTYETRSADLWPVDFEMRAEATADGLTFTGYAAKYNEPSWPLAFPGINRGRPFREVIRTSAFSKTLSEKPDLALVINHDLTGLPLARTSSGTMTITDDGIGLKVRAILPDNERGRAASDAVRRGDVRGMSFRFDKAQDKWTTDETGGSVRELLAVRLRSEVSFATFPAYDSTEAAVRALAEEAGVDPDALIGGFANLRPDTKLTPDQRAALVEVINRHTDAPVVDKSAVTAINKTLLRERLEAIAKG